jgi:acetyl esterase/lipase
MGGRTAILPSHIQAFNDGGYHVVSIDYRLAPETKLPEIVCDVEDAWTWLREHADSVGIDRSRIAILGHSAGGYLALLGGYKLDPRPAAVVSIEGEAGAQEQPREGVGFAVLRDQFAHHRDRVEVFGDVARPGRPAEMRASA